MRAPPIRFAFGALLVSVLVTITGVLATDAASTEFRIGAGSRFVNPLYERLSAIADREGIDASFALWVADQRRGPVVDHPLFNLPEHSVDVLVLGDSTAAWGITPQVIAGVSGLRVAMFADPGMPLSVAQCSLFRALIDRYLAPGGRTLFVFAYPNIVKDPEALRFPELMDASGTTLAHHAERKWWSFDRYWDWRTDSLVSPLQAAGLRLPQASPYRSWLEQYLNPAWYTQKRESETRHSKRYLRWDGWTVMLEGESRRTSLRSTEEPRKLERWLPKEGEREHAEQNLHAMQDLPGEKLLVVPWSATKDLYLLLRALHLKYLAGAAGLIDLGKLHPEGVAYPMADKVHMKNESGFEASVLLGKWLREATVSRATP